MRALQQRNWRYSLRAALGLLFIALFGVLVAQACTPSSQALGGGEQETTVGVGVGEMAPDFALTDLEGNPFRLSDLRGKVVFINFWATWCPPCRAEMPEIEAIYQEYKDKGVVVVGVDIMETEAEVRQFVQRGGYSWTFVIDKTGEVTAGYSIAAIPTSIFIDREGIIRAVNIGAMTKRAMEAKLAETMR